jgi:hypothetical protein
VVHAGLANVLCEQDQPEAALAHVVAGLAQLEQLGGQRVCLEPVFGGPHLHKSGECLLFDGIVQLARQAVVLFHQCQLAAGLQQSLDTLGHVAQAHPQLADLILRAVLGQQREVPLAPGVGCAGQRSQAVSQAA